MKIPEWLKGNHVTLNSYLPDIKTLRDYVIYHDCGKHLVKELDEEGRVHYPNHANASADYWKENGGCEEVEKLIRNDMFFHTCSAKELEETDLTKAELATLLLTSLAEIHANAELFGGIESTSFKSKFKQIDRRGKKFCKGLKYPTGNGHCYVFVRGDLPEAQRAIQAGHAAIESQRRFKSDCHPSLVYLRIKNEKKLTAVIKELLSHDINCVLFRDDIFDDQITAVATEPLFEGKRELLGRYTLL